jgi:hypothetical protein
VTEQLLLFDVQPEPVRGDSSRCVDCDVDCYEIDEYYMVHDDVWPIAPFGGMLCIGCIEARIGRRLTPTDFTDRPMNRWPGRSRRFVARLPNAS